MSHTNGNWKTARTLTHTTKPRSVIFTSNDKELIFEILHNEKSLSEQRANAKLIAAAPDLLQATQNVLDDLELFGKIQPTTIEHLKTTLEKATK